jgi:preprotein translocase subunit SecB
MKYSPLYLQGCYFTEVKISAQSASKPEDANSYDINIETEPSKTTADQPRQWVVIVRVKINPKEGATPPYLGEVEAIGSFSVDDSWEESKIESLVYVNGSGLVYAAIREMICTVTARGFFDMLLLPSCSFGQMYKELLNSRQELEKKHAESKSGTVEPSTAKSSDPSI